MCTLVEVQLHRADSNQRDVRRERNLGKSLFRDLRNNSERTTPTASQSKEEVSVLARVDGQVIPSGRNNFELQLEEEMSGY